MNDVVHMGSMQIRTRPSHKFITIHKWPIKFPTTVCVLTPYNRLLCTQYHSDSYLATVCSITSYNLLAYSMSLVFSQWRIMCNGIDDLLSSCCWLSCHGMVLTLSGVLAYTHCTCTLIISDCMVYFTRFFVSSKHSFALPSRGIRFPAYCNMTSTDYSMFYPLTALISGILYLIFGSKINHVNFNMIEN